ncbi:MAG: amidohydrolase [Spirochaetes bacterium]|nr:amidohydrolase [Spirochaetota bacterium]
MERPLVLVNGIVRTMDARGTVASAVAARAGRVVFVGDDREAREAAAVGPGGSPAEMIDLRGACVLPGLVDAHLHFAWFARSLEEVDAGTRTRGEAVERVRARAAATPAGEWIGGSSWDHNVWDRLPSRQDLDAAAPRNPVALKAKSGHAMWASSLALERAGIRKVTPDPAGGMIARDPAGEPTGILYENAMNLVWAAIPAMRPEEIAASMRAAQERALAAGLTGFHDFDSLPAFRAFQLLREQGGLDVRVVKGIPREALGEAAALGLRSGFGDELLSIGPVKLFADGALGPQTAWMLEPYEGSTNTGIPTLAPEELRADIARARAAGLACAVHAIGDAAVRAVLDAFAAAGADPAGLTAARPRLPDRIEHVQLVSPADLSRLARLGIVASMQPIHATSDIDIADRHWGARTATAYAWRSVLDSGAVLAFGSDCPVETVRPLAGIHAAVTRRRADGSPGPDGWHPEQRLTVEQAVRSYTLGAARAAGRERETGTIEPGKFADFTVLGADPFVVEPHEIRDVPVRATIVGGRLRWGQ